MVNADVYCSLLATMGGYHGDGRTDVRPHMDSVIGALDLSGGQVREALVVVRGATHASGRLSKKKQSGRMAGAM